MKGISNDVPWRGQGDVIRNRTTGSGKGDKGRPREITREEFDNSWDRTFGKKEESTS